MVEKLDKVEKEYKNAIDGKERIEMNNTKLSKERDEAIDKSG